MVRKWQIKTRLGITTNARYFGIRSTKKDTWIDFPLPKLDVESNG